MRRELTLSVLLWTSVTHAQKPFTDVEAIENKAIEHIENQEFDLAAQEYLKIPVYDSTYEQAALQRVLLYFETEDYEKALEICDRGIRHGKKYKHLAYQNKGACFLRMEQPEMALSNNEAGLKVFPQLVDLKYNSALALLRLGEHKKALEALKQLILEHPYYPEAHFELGKMALHENETARMLMCFNTYQLLTSNTQLANSLLEYTNQVLTASKDSVPWGVFKGSDESFGKLNQLLDNYIAMDKDYKTGLKVNWALVKQNHLLLTQLAEENGRGKGFWNEFYVPLYKGLMDDGQFEGFIYSMLYNSSLDEVKKLASKKSGEIKQTQSWLSNYWSTTWNRNPSRDAGDLTFVRSFHPDFGLKNEGFVNMQEGSSEGLWTYYTKEGYCSGRGSFKNNERHGSWEWFYPDGSVLTTAKFTNGKLSGTLSSYYENGNKSNEGNFENDEKIGIHVEYYPDGTVKTSKGFKAGKEDGVSLSYYPNGQLADSIPMKGGLAEGPYITYHANGALNTTGVALEGKYNGTIRSYFINGTLASEYSYVNGESDGSGKEYHENGQLAYEGEYRDGHAIGTHSAWRIDGSSDYQLQYDDGGKLNGTKLIYDYHGNKYEAHTYSKGLITAYQFFDKDGNVIREAKKKGSDFDYRGMYFDGTPKSEGVYNVKGGPDGKWVFKDRNGVLSAVENYLNDEQHGKQKYYHSNGQISAEYMMVEGALDGVYKSYHFNGELREHGRYIDGVKEGEWFEYDLFGDMIEVAYFRDDILTFNLTYDVEGNKDIESWYDDGTLDSVVLYAPNGEVHNSFSVKNGYGDLEYTYEGGQKQVDGFLVGGKRHGPFKYMEFNGQASSEGEYLLGEQHGKWRYYHENGQLHKEHTYLNGKLIGKSKEWNWFGDLTEEAEHEDGMLVGERRSYHGNGKLSGTTVFSYGKVNGPRKFFTYTEDLMMERYYDHGILTSYGYLGKDHKLVDPIPVNRADAELKSYYPNGQIARTYKMKNGMFQGPLKAYYPDGTLFKESEFIDDNYEGTSTTHFPDGKVHNAIEYRFGTRHGPSVVYWPNGNKRLEITYKKGSKHGTAVQFNEAGKAILEFVFYDNQLISEKKL